MVMFKLCVLLCSNCVCCYIAAPEQTHVTYGATSAALASVFTSLTVASLYALALALTCAKSQLVAPLTVQ